MRTEEGVVWVLGVEIYELSTYHFPISRSPHFCAKRARSSSTAYGMKSLYSTDP
jgi:hypothetical protein